MDMDQEHPAFGRELGDPVKLGAVDFRPEPLDAIVDRRLKAIWAVRVTEKSNVSTK
jgi:hypothetical protein